MGVFELAPEGFFRNSGFAGQHHFLAHCVELGAELVVLRLRSALCQKGNRAETKQNRKPRLNRYGKRAQCG